MALWLHHSLKKKVQTQETNKKMDSLLDRFYEDVDFAVKNKFRENIVKLSELNSSFFVLIKRYRGKILAERQKFLFDNLKEITENVYKEYVLKWKEFERDYFLYFKLAKSYINYQFHFVVIKKDYIRNRRDSDKTVDA